VSILQSIVRAQNRILEIGEGHRSEEAASERVQLLQHIVKAQNRLMVVQSEQRAPPSPVERPRKRSSAAAGLPAPEGQPAPGARDRKVLTNCRYGMGCRRPDCRFRHPAARDALMSQGQGQPPAEYYEEPSAAFAADGRGAYYYDGREELPVEQASVQRGGAGRGRRRGGLMAVADDRQWPAAAPPLRRDERDYPAPPPRYAVEPPVRRPDSLGEVLRACESIRGIGRRVIDTLKEVISAGYYKPGANVGVDANFDLTAQMLVECVERFGPDNVANQLDIVYSSLERTPGFKKGLFNFLRGTLRNLLEGRRK